VYEPHCADAPAFELSGGLPLGGVYTNAAGLVVTTFDPATGAGTYSFTYSYEDENGCSASCDFTIVVNALPEVTCPSYDPLCTDAPAFELSGGLPAGGVYTDAAGLVVTTFDPAAGAGTYSFTYSFTDIHGCSASCDFAIVVNALPEVSCPDPIDVCVDGEIIEFNPAINETYAYNGTVITSFDPTGFEAGIYEIDYTVTGENGCTNGCTFTITVHSLPVTSCIDFEICENAAPIGFNPTQYETFTFDGQVITSFDPATFGLGNYDIYYTITTEFGCTSNCMFTITVLPIPVITSEPESVSALWGENATFTVLAEHATGFAWFGPNGLIAGTQNILLVEAIELADQGIYYCEVSNDCATVQTVTVTLEVLPWSQTIPLPLKINGFSTYLDLTDCDLETVVAPIADYIESIEFMSEVYVPGSTPMCWDEQFGAKLSLNDNTWPKELTVFGYPILGKELSLPSGWSIMPVWSYGVVSADDIFEQFGSNLVMAISIDYSGAYWFAGGIHTLFYLNPGSSYLVRLNAPAVVSFDVPLVSVPQINASTPPNKTTWEDVEMTGNLHAISISKDVLATLLRGDVIGAFNQVGKIGGMVEVTGFDENLLLRVFADDKITSEVDGFAEGDQISFRVYRSSTGETFDLITGFDPKMPNTNIFETRGMSMTISQKSNASSNPIFNGDHQIKVYPNPADDFINVLSTNPVTRIEIISLLGQTMISETTEAQSYKLDISELEPGMYVVKVLTKDGNTHFRKILVR
jgi:hypothetical protein